MKPNPEKASVDIKSRINSGEKAINIQVEICQSKKKTFSVCFTLRSSNFQSHNHTRYNQMYC